MLFAKAPLDGLDYLGLPHSLAVHAPCDGKVSLGNVRLDHGVLRYPVLARVGDVPVDLPAGWEPEVADGEQVQRGAVLARARTLTRRIHASAAGTVRIEGKEHLGMDILGGMGAVQGLGVELVLVADGREVQRHELPVGSTLDFEIEDGAWVEPGASLASLWVVRFGVSPPAEPVDWLEYRDWYIEMAVTESETWLSGDRPREPYVRGLIKLAATVPPAELLDGIPEPVLAKIWELATREGAFSLLQLGDAYTLDYKVHEHAILTAEQRFFDGLAVLREYFGNQDERLNVPR